MNTATLSALWPIKNPLEPEPLGGGINNRTFRVRSDSGDFVLRIYPQNAPAEKIDFEMALLTSLSYVTFPFQVPMPLPSCAGDLAPVVPDAGQARAILVPVIPGSTCQPASLDQASSAGAALGLLTKALAAISLPVALRGNYADLEGTNPLLPNPLDAADLPFVDAASRKRLTCLLEEMMSERHSWYPVLPHQIIHGDYVPFNLLMAGDRVSGVLDFELACNDVRAMDFAIGFWPWLRWGGNIDWAMAEAFGQGYTAHQPLTPAEADALPFLLRLRRAKTLVWWSGRYRQGVADESAAQWAASAALDMEDWIAAHRGELVAYASRLL